MVCSRRLSTEARTRRTTRGISGTVSAMIDVPHARPHEGHQGQREQDGGDGHEPVHDAHDHRVERGGSSRRRGRRRPRGARLASAHRGADEQRDAPAVERARVDVTPELIGAEPLFGRGLAQRMTGRRACGSVVPQRPAPSAPTARAPGRPRRRRAWDGGARGAARDPAARPRGRRGPPRGHGAGAHELTSTGSAGSRTT